MSGKIKIGLRKKFTIGLLLLGIVITITAAIAGVVTYSDSITRSYNDLAYKIADTAASYFTDDELAAYADLTYRYNRADANEQKALKQEILSVTETPRYKEVKSLLDSLRGSMRANDIYVGVFDIEVLKNLDEKAYENHEWNPLYYISDSYYLEDEQFTMGDKSRIVSGYRFIIADSYTSGKKADVYYVTNGDFGHIISAIQPIVQDGSVVACVGVEIPMETLESDINQYIANIGIAAGIALFVLMILTLIVIIRILVNPIELVTKEAASFVENNTEISEMLPKVRTGDEVQVLSESILSLEHGIKEYISNLTKVTAEKERIGAELSVAAGIQVSQLPGNFPAFPDRTEFDIFASMTPAKEVGGDFYDFFMVDDDHIGMVMADVSGKGVPAALFMMISKILIKSRVQSGDSPGEALATANNQLCEGNDTGFFVTVWLAVLEISTGKGIAANAGHEHPVLRRDGGEYELVKYKHSMAVATLEDIPFAEHEFEMHPGDSLFVYTDGVAEATNADNELFGTDRMLESLNKNPDAEPEEILRNVMDGINEFVAGAEQFDDITMLCFKLNKQVKVNGENKAQDSILKVR